MEQQGWRHHSYAKDIYGVKRAEEGLKKKGWVVMAFKHSCGWNVMIKKKEFT